MSKAPSTTTEMHDYIIEHGTATAEEIALVTSINGTNIEAYENILYARTGYRSFDQLEEFDDDEEDDTEEDGE